MSVFDFGGKTKVIGILIFFMKYCCDLFQDYILLQDKS